MIKISIITVFPELHERFVNTSLIQRAVERKLVQFNFIRLSDMCQPKERIDEPTVGHGAGMIIKPEVIQKAIELCQEKFGLGFKIFFSPQGQRLDQRKLSKFYKQLITDTQKPSACEASEAADTSTGTHEISQDSPESQLHLILICSRYEGIDERIERLYADAVISIGDYVLMGGDLPAQVFIEGFLRLFPSVVGKAESVENESFQSAFFDHPEYGLPVEWNGMKIPDILRSGNHELIDAWRKEQAVHKTLLNRFDWIRKNQLDQKDVALCKKFIPPHYVVIMHSQVIVGDGSRTGHTSVASIDIHDLARSCKTYGIKNFFIVTQLEDQFKIVSTFFEFWHSKRGQDYNLSRYNAIESVILSKSFDAVLGKIKEQENADPIIITTSAKTHGKGVKIDYFSQGLVWKENRPVVIVFGTGQGLSDEIMDQSNFILTPVKGLTDYNHLSVRSAAAIILDRWLGLNPKIE
jgi:tRNA (guanine37-N1)-methyltransferase